MMTASPRTVSAREWLAARRALLEREKELTRLRDAVAAERQALPWTLVDKAYRFQGPQGDVLLADLFEGRSQLIVYHFMYGPGWAEGCPGCSFLCDHIDGANLHLAHHDVSLVVVSRAPYAEFLSFKARMGWSFPWYSSFESDFNFDYQVSYSREDLDWGEVMHNFTAQKLKGEEQPGISCFYKDADGQIYHTYSCYERGGDNLIGAYHWLDIAPLGRNEAEPMDWMRHHDRYEKIT